MYYKITIGLLLVCFVCEAQTKISGKVMNGGGATIPGANVFVKDSYDGASTDSAGRFSFMTSETGSRILTAGFIGYENTEQKVELNGKDVAVSIKLKEKNNELNTVTITAGEFEASDEKKMVILRPLDIVTTAGANGDIYGALQTLPGTQPIGEKEGLFVRGGDASETKTLIDGVVVENPYFSGVPDVPQRGRFSPFLFKGTNFSTGGYSAQYGGAMSSALILESQDMPAKTTTDIALMSVGGGLDHIHRWKNTSVGVFANYVNLKPYFSLDPQNRDWTTPPQSVSGSVIARHKTSETGMLKMFANYQYSDLSLNYLNLNDPALTEKDHFELNNNYFFSTLSYKEMYGKDWTTSVSGSYSKSLDHVNPFPQRLVFNNETSQGRATITRGLGQLSCIRAGGESQYIVYENLYNNYSKTIHELLTAAFLESDIYITSKLVARVGVRAEDSYVLHTHDVALRTSLAYKVSNYNQFSFAYGDFYQPPPDTVFQYQNNVRFQKATHYILNFQHTDDYRTFRVEVYYKKYNDLIKSFSDTTSVNGRFYDNSGDGYARGVDVFWRDKKTFKYVDYWISYSYLDTKRNYYNYPVSATPPYAAQNVASVVFKRWFPKLNCSLGFTYVFSSGRPYLDPNKMSPDNFLSDKTKNYNNLSLSGSYLTMIGKHFTVIAVGVGNVLGVENIFTYNYSADGYRRQAIGPTTLRSYFIGMFISIGSDKTDDI